ncbi:radical SAM protein [Cetobacterium sp.]|uniref:radical SAM protein n=1 Tax=Cetobacterium sp. TaxID=2071632 RepID=UPI003F3DB871
MISKIKKSYMDDTLNISITKTYNCNLRCSYCYQKTEKKNEEFNDSDFNKFLIKIKESLKNNKYKNFVIDLMGGEVYLNSKEYLFYLKEVISILNNDKITIYLGSNFFSVDSDFLNLINYIKNFEHKICISIDFNKKIHDENRGVSFEKIIKNIEKSKIDKKNINISCVIKDYCPTFSDFYFLFNYGNKISLRVLRKHKLDDDYFLLIKKTCKVMIDFFNKNKNLTNISLEGISINEFIFNILTKSNYCKIKNMLFLNSDGKVYNCTNINELMKNKNIFIKNNKFQKTLEDKIYEDKECYDCFLNFTCRKKCFLENENNCIDYRKKTSKIILENYLNFFEKNFEEKIKRIIPNINELEKKYIKNKLKELNYEIKK